MIKTSILLTMSILFNNGNEEGDIAVFLILTEEQAADCQSIVSTSACQCKMHGLMD
jgi:hypothetical protein